MKTIVVLGMHGGGTSMVAGMLDAMGVNMHYNPNARVKDYTNYEDTDFVRLNAAILQAAGGNWKSPPGVPEVGQVAEQFSDRVGDLIAEKSDCDLWGWKDPRSALTIQLYHDAMTDPHYIYVKRQLPAIAQSIISRGPPKTRPKRWADLAKGYYGRINWFLKEFVGDSRWMQVYFEELVKGGDWQKTMLEGMAQFIGLPDIREAVRAALTVVK